MLKEKDILDIQSEIIEHTKKNDVLLLPTAYKKLFMKFAKNKGFSEDDCLNADKELAFERLKEKSINLKNDKINDVYMVIDDAAEKLVIYLEDGKKALDDSIEEIKRNRDDKKEELKKKVDVFLEQYSSLVERVSEIKDNIENLEDVLQNVNEMSIQDPVSSFGNCKYFEMAFNGELYTIKRYDTPTTLILLRMKNIAQIQNRYSESVKNKVIKSLANIIYENIRASDVLCRCKEEDFRILLHNTDIEKGRQFAQKIKYLLNKIVFQKGEDRFKVNFLYGATQIKKTDTIETALMRIALNS